MEEEDVNDISCQHHEWYGRRRQSRPPNLARWEAV
jgi:hypothetical protein